MADCSEISLMLGPFEDGELDPHEMQDVARHLSCCKDCEKLLEEYSEIGRELRTVASESELGLEGFAAAVDARLKELRVPWRRRIGLLFDGWGWQMQTALTSMAVVATAAVVTILVISPLARVYLNRQAPANYVARIQANKIATRGEQQLASAQKQVSATTSDSSEAIISRLESNTSSVALWSAPRDGTTVIWLPQPSQQSQR